MDRPRWLHCSVGRLGRPRLILRRYDLRCPGTGRCRLVQSKESNLASLSCVVPDIADKETRGLSAGPNRHRLPVLSITIAEVDDAPCLPT